jgi:hypothetical protein
MATVNTNGVSYGIVSGSGYKQLHLPCANASDAFHVGDLVYLNVHLKALDTDGNAASGVGIALQPSLVNSGLDNSSAPAPTSALVGWDLVANMLTTASEVYANGMAVYIGADAQTITSVAGSHKVGRIVLPDGISTLTGASGLRIGVAIISNLF